MNELNKLLTSLLLLGGGFFAASFVGPPEVVDRLSWYLSRPASEDPQGLRPMPFGSPATDEAGWPERPNPQAVTAVPAAAAVEAPVSEPRTASVSAMIAPASWPGEANRDPGPAPSAAALTPPPLGDDWHNSANYGQAQSPAAAPSPAEAAPARPLTPIERTPHTVAKEPTVWPELRSPLAEPTTAPAERPSLENSPYGARPSFNASASAEPSGFPSLSPGRTIAASAEPAPLERQPIATAYTQHVVTDGDTLHTIAERYLGDGARAQELFELNRDRLDHPDVLPIGMVIRTPERRAMNPQPTTDQAFPPRAAGGAFTTVAAHEASGAYARPATHAVARPVTPLTATDERPLSESDRLGPADAVYNRELSWDENRW